MSANSAIQWTTHTFNPWIGCAKVSPGCLNCYAETLDTMRFSKTLGDGTKDAPVSHWGKGAPRHRTSISNWKQPIKWNKQQGELIKAWNRQTDDFKRRFSVNRPRVFCASLADWLDEEVPIEWLADLLDLIRVTPNLDWLLLTKRPENFHKRLEAVLAMIPKTGIDMPTAALRARIVLMLAGGWNGATYIAPELGIENYWIGTTVEDQQRADERIPILLDIPARVRFLSCEPLLGPVDLRGPGLYAGDSIAPASIIDHEPRIHWVICGGESGTGNRPMDTEWARSLHNQCAAAHVPFFMKQLGGTRDHRGNLEDFPQDLQIRQFPTP